MKDEKEIIKYHNDMNKISMGTFNEKELDLFFTICFKLKEAKTNEIIIPFSELKEMIGVKENPQRLTQYIDNLNKKLASITQKIEIAPNVFELFVLFTNLTTDYNTGTLTIKTNEKFLYILNNLISNYTKFELMEFINLKSVYSKNMFKLLKQWEFKKEREFLIEEFRYLLTIPVKYRISEIDKFVLFPIMSELPAYFLNLRLEKIKTGKKVTALKFTWLGKEDIIKIEETPEKITISQNLYNLIKEIQNLNFFKNVMTPRNIEKLTKKYDEKTLVQILKKAKDSTFQPIKSIKYFDYVYESIKNEPVIIIKPAEKIIEKDVPNNAPVEKIEKIDITLKEFNKKYKEYLKKWKTPDDPFVKRAFEIKYNIVEVEEKSIQEIKVFTEKDIPENELLGKNGKKLAGMALKMRIKMILKKNDLV